MAILYLDPETHAITDDEGKVISVDEAKQLLQIDQVKDCNLSFQRLANYNFDFDKLDEFYRENPFKRFTLNLISDLISEKFR